MGVKALPIPPIPAETVRVAQASCGDELLAIQVRDQLGTICTDEDFTHMARCGTIRRSMACRSRC